MLSVKSLLMGSDQMCISLEGGTEDPVECLVEDSWFGGTALEISVL